MLNKLNKNHYDNNYNKCNEPISSIGIIAVKIKSRLI